jgi:hypothetical protein
MCSISFFVCSSPRSGNQWCSTFWCGGQARPEDEQDVRVEEVRTNSWITFAATDVQQLCFLVCSSSDLEISDSQRFGTDPDPRISAPLNYGFRSRRPKKLWVRIITTVFEGELFIVLCGENNKSRKKIKNCAKVYRVKFRKKIYCYVYVFLRFCTGICLALCRF